MRAVNGEIRGHRSSKLPVVCASYPAEAAPEQPVMHQQQINVLFNRKLDCRLTCVYGSANLCYPPVILQLQSIERIWVVFNFIYLQKPVEKVANPIEHGAK